MMEILKPILIGAGAAIMRSVFGWARTAFADNKITKFEVKKLAETVIRVGLISICGYFVATGLLDIDAGTTEAIGIGAAAILVDKLFSVVQETKNVTKK